MWNFFGFKPDNDAQGLIICRHCFVIITAPQGSTANLCKHLQRHHKIQYELTVKDKRTTSTTSVKTASFVLFCFLTFFYSCAINLEKSKKEKKLL